MAAGGGTKAVVMAMVANGGIAIAKFVGFTLTGSSAMLAEAIHSVADTSNQGLLLFGGKRARREANDVHQFGYGRERYFWAFVVALLLFSVGAGFALYEGIEKIRHPHEIERWPIAVGILCFGIVLEGFAFYTAFKESLKIKPEGQSLWQFIRRTRNPELPVVLLEDSAAMLGLFVALGGIGLSLQTDNYRWDGIATTVIGVILASVAVILAIEMKSLLIGESATKIHTGKIIAAIEADSVVEELIDLKTMHTGPEDILVVARVRFAEDIDTAELAKEIDDLQASIQSAVAEAVHIYIEPDLRVPGVDVASANAAH